MLNMGIQFYFLLNNVIILKFVLQHVNMACEEMKIEENKENVCVCVCVFYIYLIVNSIIESLKPNNVLHFIEKHVNSCAV
jgi:hypothetical protein